MPNKLLKLQNLFLHKKLLLIISLKIEMHFDYIACSYIAKLNVEMTEPFTKFLQIAIANIFKKT